MDIQKKNLQFWFVWKNHILRIKKNEKYRGQAKDSLNEGQKKKEIAITFKDLHKNNYEEIFTILNSKNRGF